MDEGDDDDDYIVPGIDLELHITGMRVVELEASRGMVKIREK